MNLLGYPGGPPQERIYHRTITRPSGRARALLTAFALGVTSLTLRAQPHVTTNVTLTASSSRRAPSVTPQPPRFPHLRHARLFPTCAGCHADVTGTRTEDLFPRAPTCTTCHNGTDAATVAWTPPSRPARQGLLRFSHRTHFARTDSAGRTCATCHAVGDTAATRTYMNVAAAREPACRTCHAADAPAHYDAPGRCATCHVPLVRAVALAPAAIRDLPQPASHRAVGFAAAHAPRDDAAVAQCATCHARESCARCHLDAAAVRQVAALEADARVAALTRGRPGVYPVPESHRRPDFATGHGNAAAGATCATCHVRSSCTACHTGAAARDAIRRLVEPQDAGRGVRLTNPHRERVGDAAARQKAMADTGTRQVRAHLPGFLTSHPASAASGTLTCEGCHARRFCAECHAGEARRAFHPANFTSRHATSVYAADRECSSCHNTEVFCRDCHRTVGLASRGGSAGIYHTAQSQWLLQHGRAARQGLETCASCHQQNTCMRCHSTTGWGVNPHGADFNAARLGRKAMAMCARCHITDPRRR